MYLGVKVQSMKVELKKYREVWKAIREIANLHGGEDPFVQPLPDARVDPFSGVWYNQEGGEEDANSEVAVAGTMEGPEGAEREASHMPRRRAMKWSSSEELLDLDRDGANKPQHGDRGEGEGDSCVDEMGETESERYQRYVQSTQSEVSDADEWADVHFGHAGEAMRDQGQERGQMRQHQCLRRERCRSILLNSVMADWQKRELSKRLEKQKKKAQAWNSFEQFCKCFQVEQKVTSAGTLSCKALGLKQSWFTTAAISPTIFSTCSDPVERAVLQRLRGSLQTLMVMSQSKDPQLWTDAAERVRWWLGADGDWHYFAEGSTHTHIMAQSVAQSEKKEKMAQSIAQSEKKEKIAQSTAQSKKEERKNQMEKAIVQ
eukprot:s101_g40.t1